MTTLGDMYSEHHRSRQREGFSILEEERGAVFAQHIGQGKTVLDIGCRDGTLTRHFVQGNTIVGVDIDTDLLRKAKKALGIETRSFDLNGDWSDLVGQTFDVVVAGEILEHVYYPEKIIQKARSVLNRRGMFIGSVPNAFSAKNRVRLFLGKKANTPLADPTHINHFSVQELRQILNRYFTKVQILGLGRHEFLARNFPGMCAFDIVFVATV